MIKQHLLGRKRYPLVLMLEPLFRCNLACAGCGKIDYPDEILNQRLSVQECMDAIDECGAPVVAIAGGEPLLHRDMAEIVKGSSSARSSSSCAPTRCCWTKKIDQYKPLALPGLSVIWMATRRCTTSRCAWTASYEKAVAAIKLAKAKGFRAQINCTLFDGAIRNGSPNSSTR